jgi:hypothetical protein
VRPGRSTPASYAPGPKPAEHVVRFEEPATAKAPPATPDEMVAENEAAIDAAAASDSDISRTGSSLRRARRRTPRRSTSYILAQPAPKLRRQQRLIHIHPTLLVQVQELSAGKRPTPAIDVYPSSAIANSTIAAHILKRFPRLARIKRELSLQDVLLLKSEKYDNESEDEGDEADIHKREVVAILSQSTTSLDTTEIVLADGTVWIAKPQRQGSSCYYEFVTVDDFGHTTTARWVRRQAGSQSVPDTPTSSISSSVASMHSTSAAAHESKFTFSIIDPACRRHPVLATLQPTCLEVRDTYTTVSQSAGRYPPTSPLLASPIDGDDVEPERTTREVEAWQKTFIQVSALWVTLRQGWVHFASTEVMAAKDPTLSASQTSLPTRSSSVNSGTDRSRRRTTIDTSFQRRCPSAFRDVEPPADSMLPRRATSTGAAYMSKRRSEQIMSSETEGSDAEAGKLRSRRVLSGDWRGRFSHLRTDSFVTGTDTRPSSSNRQEAPDLRVDTSVAELTSVNPRRKVVSEYYTSKPTFQGLTTVVSENRESLPVASRLVLESTDPFELEDNNNNNAGRPNRWRNLTEWFHKLRAR